MKIPEPWRLVKQLNPCEALVCHKDNERDCLLAYVHRAGDVEPTIGPIPFDCHVYTVRFAPESAEYGRKSFNDKGFTHDILCQDRDVSDYTFNTTPEKYYMPGNYGMHLTAPTEAELAKIGGVVAVIYKGFYRRETRYEYKHGELYYVND